MPEPPANPPGEPQVPAKTVESRVLIDHAFMLARALEIETLLVLTDEARDVRFINKIRTAERVIWLKRGEVELPIEMEFEDPTIAIPDTQLARVDQIMFGLFMALLQNDAAFDESIVCLSGVAGSKRLDTLLIANPHRDFPWFRRRGIDYARKVIATSVFAQVIDIALRFAAEGREGRPIGTTFVIGEMEQLAPHIRQLILNPLEGHPQKLRNIFSPEFVESLRELSALDGAIIVNNKGIVEAAGAYIDVKSSGLELPSGLGARHAAAGAVTSVAETVALAISESSGAVTVFHGGEIILKFSRPGQVESRRRRKKRVVRKKKTRKTGTS